MAKRERLPEYTTPRGVYKFPWLGKPDTGPKDGSFKMEPTYRVSLVLEGDEAAALKKQIEDAHRANVKAVAAKNKGKKIKEVDRPYKPETNDDGEETGATEFTFKMKAESKMEDGTVIKRKPALFDAKLKKLPADTKVGGGTVGKVSYQLYPFYTAGLGAGVSLRLLAAQIIDLKTFGERDGKGYGFGEEEGYEAPEGSEESAETEEESTDEGDKEDLAF
jgi:hypothetical protein